MEPFEGSIVRNIKSEFAENDINALNLDSNEKCNKVKRSRNPKSHKRYMNKVNRERGLQYETTKGKIMPQKKFKIQVCDCRFQCHKQINETKQMEIFSHFYNLSTWTSKTVFINNHIELKSCVKRRKPEKRKTISFKKKYSRKYMLPVENNQVQVCKNFFKKLLQISDCRINYCLNVLNRNGIFRVQDLRGKHPNKRKTTAEAICNVINFVRSFPVYESHYVREQKKQLYLSPSLNIKKLYDEYCIYCETTNFEKVSKYMFYDIFRRRINLKFKRPLQDTCNTCDQLTNQIKHKILTTKTKIQLLEKKASHLHLVECIQKEYKDFIEHSKLVRNEEVVLIFDLEKVLDTPKLSSNIVYYKRQLCTYNFCIHDATKNRSFMYVWNESVASRGAQEISSCLLYHFKNFVPNECKKIILYSDGCAGQNKNIKMSLMLTHFLQNHATITSVVQNFFVSGHSYNVCDRKFGLIEKCGRRVSNIYTPDLWFDIINTAKTTAPPFVVTKMNSADFFSSENLEKSITNRKKTISNETFNWHHLSRIEYKKETPLVLYIEVFSDTVLYHNEQTENQTYEPKIVKIHKRGIDPNDFKDIELKLLYPDGRMISEEKKKDLLQLLDYIPQPHHSFYANLKCSDEVDDADRDIILSDSDNE